MMPRSAGDHMATRLNSNPSNKAVYEEMAKVYLYEAVEKVEWAGRQAVYSFAEGDEQRMLLMGLKRFTKLQPFNLTAAKRKIADYVIENNKYPFT